MFFCYFIYLLCILLNLCLNVFGITNNFRRTIKFKNTENFYEQQVLSEVPSKMLDVYIRVRCYPLGCPALIHCQPVIAITPYRQKTTKQKCIADLQLDQGEQISSYLNSLYLSTLYLPILNKSLRKCIWCMHLYQPQDHYRKIHIKTIMQAFQPSIWTLTIANQCSMQNNCHFHDLSVTINIKQLNQTQCSIFPGDGEFNECAEIINNKSVMSPLRIVSFPYMDIFRKSVARKTAVLSLLKSANCYQHAEEFFC